MRTKVTTFDGLLLWPQPTGRVTVWKAGEVQDAKEFPSVEAAREYVVTEGDPKRFRFKVKERIEGR